MCAAQPALDRVHTSWQTIVTDTPWTTVTACQIDRSCEVMRHAQSRFPPGNTARERQQKLDRLRESPRRRPVGLEMYHVQQISRQALANSIPPSHDAKFVTSSMPVGVSMRSTHNPGRHGWVR